MKGHCFSLFCVMWLIEKLTKTNQTSLLVVHHINFSNDVRHSVATAFTHQLTKPFHFPASNILSVSRWFIFQPFGMLQYLTIEIRVKYFRMNRRTSESYENYRDLLACRIHCILNVRYRCTTMQTFLVWSELLTFLLFWTFMHRLSWTSMSSTFFCRKYQKL